MRRGRRDPRHVYAGTVALLWLVLALVVLLNKHGVFTPDIKPEVYLAPGRTADDLLTGWLDTQQLGFPNFNVGLTPVAAFVWLLRGLGLSAALCVRFLHLALLILGGWGATRLFVAVAGPHASRTGRVLAGVLYVANPYTVVAGDTLAIMLPYGFLPWQMLFLLRALERPGSWRWPAAFALTFVAMSGMNAGVVPLLQLVYVPALIWYVATRRVVSVRALAGALGRCGLLALLVSLYWLVPAVAARGVGSNVIANSESLSGIAGPSSFSEVLRGLGLWVMYGSGPDGAWQPGFTSYLDNPLVIVLSFGLPVVTAVAVMLTGGALRRLGLSMVVLAAVVMVGLFPPDNPSPVGRLMRFGFSHVPALGAFRTTNKAGAVLVLGVALLVGAAGTVLVRRRLRRGELRVAAGALAVVLVGATWPAWSGGLFSDQLRIPRYWHQAAAAVDSGSPVQRVWLLPGEVRSHYRWSQERVDDIDKSLLSRPSFVETTVPNSSAVSANFLAAVDTQLQEGALPPGALSAAARYMGVSDVLLRNDLVWEQTAGARPADVQDQVARDAGLLPAGNFGAPGQNTRSKVEPPVSAVEAVLPPVQHYRVADSRLMARVEPLRGGVLVEGDGWSLAPLLAAGLLPGDPSLRYVGDLTSTNLDQAVKAGTRLVITDSNRRRSAATTQLADSQGPLLPAGRDPGPSRVLFGPDAQTVLQVEGGSVTASSSGGVFVAQSNAAPENAFDGDPRTAWVFGDFGRALGQRIRLRTTSPHEISEVGLLMRPRGPVTIAQVRLEVGRLVRTVNIPPSGVAHVSFPPQRTDRIQLRVTRTRGSGINAVGVEEISVPGVQVLRVAKMPDRLDGLVRDLDPAAVQALATTPIDVVLSRVMGTRSPDDDEETGLNRDFTLPQSRTYRLYGLVRPDSAAADDTIDRLLGVSGDIVAISSSRAFNSPDVRASYAVDGNPFTAWSPAEPSTGSWLEFVGRPRFVDHVDVRQASPNVTRVQVYLDGKLAADAALRPDRTRIPVPPQRASRMRLVITERTGTGLVQLSEVGFGGARMSRHSQGGLRECVEVATLDGKPLRMRPASRLTGLEPTIFEDCDGPLTMAAGPHRLRALRQWMPDQLVFRDSIGEVPLQPAPSPPATVEKVSASHWRVTTTLPHGPQLLVLGQNFDPRWAATMDGHPLGPTVAADGYSAAWVVDSPGRHTFDVRFTPQRYATAALGVSAVAALVCAGLALRRDRRRWPAPAPGPVGGRRPGTRTRRVAAWLAVVAIAFALGGPVVGVAAVVLTAWHAWRPPPPRDLMRVAVLLLVLLPVAYVLGNATRWVTISPYLVWHNQWPHWLAGCALLLLCVGVWREDAQADAVEPRLDR